MRSTIIVGGSSSMKSTTVRTYSARSISRTSPRATWSASGVFFTQYKVVNLHRVDAEPAQLAGRGQHVVVRFAGQAEDHVGADFEAAPAAALDGVDHRVVMMAAVHPVERAVVHRLHAVLDGDVACLYAGDRAATEVALG